MSPITQEVTTNDRRATLPCVKGDGRDRYMSQITQAKYMSPLMQRRWCENWG